VRRPAPLKTLLALGAAGALIWALVPGAPSGPRLAPGRAAEPLAPVAPVALTPAPVVVQTVPSPAAGPAAAPEPSDEASLMAELRRVKDQNPALVEKLAREGNRRYPNSPDAPERASLLIHALAIQGRASEARGEAEDMVNRYPISPWLLEIEAFTGAHRHGNVELTPDGQLVMQ
jgi:hypothetical protein